jgi:hypothetical protein
MITCGSHWDSQFFEIEWIGKYVLFYATNVVNMFFYSILLLITFGRGCASHEKESPLDTCFTFCLPTPTTPLPLIITKTLTKSKTITEDPVTVTETLIEEGSFEVFDVDLSTSLETTFSEEVSTDSLEQSTTPEPEPLESNPTPSDCATPLPATK